MNQQINFNESLSPLENTKSFDFNKIEVKVLIYPNRDRPWFIASQVGKILGLTETRRFVTKLDADERRKINKEELWRVFNTRLPGGSYNGIWIITESGLYQLIMRSRKPIAKEFQRWIRKEVIPSIRQTGAYIHPKANVTKKRGPGRPPKEKITDLTPAEQALRTFKAFLEILDLLNYNHPAKSYIAFQVTTRNHPKVEFGLIEKLIMSEYDRNFLKN